MRMWRTGDGQARKERGWQDDDQAPRGGPRHRARDRDSSSVRLMKPTVWHRRVRFRAIAAVMSTVLSVAACGATTTPSPASSATTRTIVSANPTETPSPAPPTPSPSPPGPPQFTWTAATIVVQPGDRVTGVVAVGAGFLAVGYHCPGAAANFCQEPSALVWTSTDGSAWARNVVMPSRTLAFTAIDAADGRLTALAAAHVGKQWRLVVLGSSDGSAWRELATLTSVSNSAICGLTTGDAGVAFCGAQLFHAGATQLATNDGDPDSWTSPDGLSWKPDHLSVGPGDLAGSPAGFAGVQWVDGPYVDPDYGFGCDTVGGFLLSSDARSWIPGSLTPDTARFDCADVYLTGYPGGFIAVGDITWNGDFPPSTVTGRPSCWTSTDGRLWVRHDGGPGQPLSSLSSQSGALASAPWGVVTITLDGSGNLVSWATDADCASRSSVIRKTDGNFPTIEVAADASRVVVLATEGLATGAERTVGSVGVAVP